MGAVHVFEVQDAELMESIRKQAEAAEVTGGAIVSLVGAVDAFTLSTMSEADARTDVLTAYEIPAELSGTGEIRDGAVHIHAVMATAGDRAVCGHLHSATVRTHFARAYVLPVT